MSTDDEFETVLRARLADLADREDDWADPLPVARELASAGLAPDDDPAILSPAPVARRRRPWPALAVAAVVLALVVGGGLGIRELARNSGGGSSAGSAADFSAEVGGGTDSGTADASAPAAPSGNTAGSAAGGSCVNGAPGPCNDAVGCADVGAATSTGPLAGVATIRPSGITGARTASGGTATVPYQLTFADTGGSAGIRAARAVLVDGGRLCGSTGTLQPGAIQVVPVAPGAGVSGSATFTAVDSDGRPLPAGDYQVVIVIPYAVGDSGSSQLVSVPVSVVVS